MGRTVGTVTDILVAAGSPPRLPSAVDESVTLDVPVPPDSPTMFPEGRSDADAEIARDASMQMARTREMIFLVFFMVKSPLNIIVLIGCCEISFSQ